MNPVFALLIALAQPAVSTPCQSAKAVSVGATVTCDGILWPVSASRDALKCRRLDLPTCKADAKLKVKTVSAERDAFLVRAVAAETVVNRTPKPLPPWVLPTVTAATFVIGVIVGGYVVATF